MSPIVGLGLCLLIVIGTGSLWVDAYINKRKEMRLRFEGEIKGSVSYAECPVCNSIYDEDSDCVVGNEICRFCNADLKFYNSDTAMGNKIVKKLANKELI